MNHFTNAKKDYDSTPIPAELSDRVLAGIQMGKAGAAAAGRSAAGWPRRPASAWCWRD